MTTIRIYESTNNDSHGIYVGDIYLEDADNTWGYSVRNMHDLMLTLDAYARFADVLYDYLEEAVIDIAKNYGCVYRNIEELADDISRRYI